MNEDQYSKIAAKYDASLELPYRKYVEIPLTRSLMGNLKNKRVLDLACGTGFYTRMAKILGAEYAKGIDISYDMIKIAKSIEKKYPLQIDYQVADIKELTQLDKFDFVTAIWFLDYLSTVTDLSKVLEYIYQSLNSGSSFLAYILNPNCNNKEGYYIKYGIRNYKIILKDGAESKFIINGTDTLLKAYSWTMPTIESIFKSVGFKKIQWKNDEVSKEGIDKLGIDFWSNYLKYPRGIHLRCCK